jgi:hypothetical protein
MLIALLSCEDLIAARAIEAHIGKERSTPSAKIVVWIAEQSFKEVPIYIDRAVLSTWAG